MQNRIASAGLKGLRERSAKAGKAVTGRVILHNATFA
jgi:hypothetical protein